jgi:hypothetical protein
VTSDAGMRIVAYRHTARLDLRQHTADLYLTAGCVQLEACCLNLPGHLLDATPVQKVSTRLGVLAN